MTHPELLANSGSLVYISVPVILVVLNLIFKIMLNADPCFAGADVALCGSSLLLTWFARALLLNKVPAGAEGAWNLVFCLLALAFWFICLRIASARQLWSLLLSTLIGGTVLYLSARHVQNLIERGF